MQVVYLSPANWLHFCQMTLPATPGPHHTLSHEARCLAYRWDRCIALRI